MSVLRFAVLGLLAAEPRTGYRLAAQMKASTDFFWTARHSQIYATLAALEAEGLVCHAVLAGPGPRENKSYRVTDPGLAELRDWLRSPERPRAERDEFVLKVSSMWLLSPGEARALVQRHRDLHATRLEDYTRIDVGDDESLGPGTPEFATFATLQAGIGYERHRVAWCDWLLGRLPD